MSEHATTEHTAPQHRDVAAIDAERNAVLHAIGVKTFQGHTLALEVAGLESRIRTLNAEAARADAAAKEAPHV